MGLTWIIHDKRKSVKAKIENKKNSTADELDTILAINCKIFMPKLDSLCEPCQVFRKHFPTMAHCGDKEKVASKYIPNN